MSRNGFSLIELIIVVTILGTIGAIAIPRMSRAAEGSRQMTFIRNLDQLTEAAYQYNAENASYPAQIAAKALPVELKSCFRDGQYDGETSIGGIWQYCVSGNVVMVGVCGDKDYREAMMTEIDAQIDDGDLSTGRFTQQNKKKYWYTVQ